MKSLVMIMVGLLVGCGPSVPDISIHEAVTIRDIKAVKQHLAAGTDVNSKTEEGFTPLHEAAWIGDKEIVELLISEGADVNAKNENRSTPLHYAADYGHKEIVDLLRKHGTKTGEELEAKQN